MSRVFVAREHALGRTVVVKVLGPEVAADVNRERFRREIMLAAQLQHPLIVPVLSAGEQGELLWYTMPFVEGESLREEIRRGPPTSVRGAIRVLHGVLDALAYAHARGVIHRDIKPGNILRHGNHSLVTDFGVAKALSASLPHSGTTSAGIAIGTPAYMAPEQLAADPSANHRMDIYATGLLVYELLTGTQAFAGSSPQATMAAQLTRMPRDLAEVRPDVPPALASLITKMLAKSPDDRPQSATAALDELDAIVTPTGTVAPYGARGTKPTRRRAAVAAGALLIVVAGIVAAAMTRRGTRAIPGPRDTFAGATATAAARATAPAGGAQSPSMAAPPTTKVADVKGAPGAPTPTEVADRVKPPAAKSAPATANAGTSVATKKAARVTRPPVRTLNRRVAILPIRVSSSREGLTAAVQAIDDSLRKALVAAGYTLATDSELLRLMAQQNVAGGVRRAADAAGIGAVVVTDVVARGDEVSAVTQVLDVWRAQTMSARDVADADKPTELVNVVRHVSRSLDRVSWRTRVDPRRVMLFEVSNRTGVDALAALARQLDDSLRAALVRSGAEVMALDSTARATRDVVERRQLALRRGAGAIVDVAILRMRGDSASVRLSVRDMTEERTFPTVDVRIAARDAEHVRLAIGQVAARLAEALAQVNWGPKAFR